MSATDAGQREAVWVRLLELETPRIESGHLFHGLGQVALPVRWASIVLIDKMGEVTPILQGCGEDSGM